jgi:hypothetical protein
MGRENRCNWGGLAGAVEAGGEYPVPGNTLGFPMRRPQICRKPHLLGVSQKHHQSRIQMRNYMFLSIALLGACTAPLAQVSSGKARFSSYPDALIEALESVCTGPAQSFARPDPDTVECREYLPPDSTAAIIMSFDGTPENLPELVIRFRTQPDTPGYLVENDVFLHVPQKTGRALLVRRPDARLSRTLDALYVRAGGVPE